MLCIAANAAPPPPRRRCATYCGRGSAHILCLDGFSFGKLGHFDDGCGSLFQWIAFLAEPLVYDEERRSSAQCAFAESQAFKGKIPTAYYEAPIQNLGYF